MEVATVSGAVQWETCAELAAVLFTPSCSRDGGRATKRHAPADSRCPTPPARSLPAGRDRHPHQAGHPSPLSVPHRRLPPPQDETATPIKQDTKKGALRFYPYNINWCARRRCRNTQRSFQLVSLFGSWPALAELRCYPCRVSGCAGARRSRACRAPCLPRFRQLRAGSAALPCSVPPLMPGPGAG